MLQAITRIHIHIILLKPSGHYPYHQVYHSKILHSAKTTSLCVSYNQNRQQCFIQHSLIKFIGQKKCSLRGTNWIFNVSKGKFSQWPRGLRRRSLAARLLRLWVRIPPRAWIFVCCECCVLSGRGLCDGLIIRSEESYRMWRVVVRDQETSQARRLKPTRGL